VLALLSVERGGQACSRSSLGTDLNVEILLFRLRTSRVSSQTVLGRRNRRCPSRQVDWRRNDTAYSSDGREPNRLLNPNEVTAIHRPRGFQGGPPWRTCLTESAMGEPWRSMHRAYTRGPRPHRAQTKRWSAYLQSGAGVQPIAPGSSALAHPGWSACASSGCNGSLTNM
jgi:hypothetical protein